MFEKIFTNASGALMRQLVVPLVEERRQYLEYLHSKGATTIVLQFYAHAMWYFVIISGIRSPRMVSIEEIENATKVYMSYGKEIKCTMEKERSFRNRIKNWLSFCGMLENATPKYYGQEMVQQYCNYLIDLKGYSIHTIKTKELKLKNLMCYMEDNNIIFRELTPMDIDKYLAYRSNALNRHTLVNTTCSVREFLKYAASQKWCNDDVWRTVKAPRTYKHEDIPSYVEWSHVVNIMNRLSKKTDKTSIRNYAIMMLLTVYGLRNSEIRKLCISDIDWKKEVIHIRRAKTFRKQVLPLVPCVGNAIIRYIQEARQNSFKEDVLFLRMKSPVQALSGINDIVSKLLLEEGVDVKHHGAHSLRHSCATVLINNGHSYKLVADLLGHQQYDTVNIYAKVDFANLSKVAKMDWEDLL